MNPVETGFYYLQSRYYDPESCRFLDADEPAMLDLSANNLIASNLFAYCANNPVMYIDPEGHSFFNAIKNGLDILLRFILKVKNFGAIIDTLITVIPGIAEFMSAIKAARAAKALAAGGRAALTRSRKVILEFMEDELLPQIEKYVGKTIKSAIGGILPTIVDGILAATSLSIGSLIAQTIDKYDNDRNNGYVFYKKR